MKKFIILIIVIFAVQQIYAQDVAPTEKQGFIIIYAGKSYDATKKVALEAQKNLEYKLDLRNLEPNKEIGLSFPEDECSGYGYEFPANMQRGVPETGNFISVEYTNMYDGFTPGYYIVVVANYKKENAELNESLKFVKKYYKTAYIKYTDIYIGCMH